MMGQHGFISWADDDKECYTQTLDFIEKAAAYIEEKYAAKGGDAKAFGGAEISVAPAGRTQREVFAAILPWLRGQVSQQKRFIGTVQDDEKILRFVNSKDAARLAELGTSCPDHFLRTKIKPLYVDWNPQSGRPRRAEEAAQPTGSSSIARTTRRITRSANTRTRPRCATRTRRSCSIPGLGMIAWGKDKIGVARHRRILQLRGRSHARRGGDR